MTQLIISSAEDSGQPIKQVGVYSCSYFLTSKPVLFLLIPTSIIIHLISPLWIIYKVSFPTIYQGTWWQLITNLSTISAVGDADIFALSTRFPCNFLFLRVIYLDQTYCPSSLTPQSHLDYCISQLV